VLTTLGFLGGEGVEGRNDEKTTIFKGLGEKTAENEGSG